METNTLPIAFFVILLFMANFSIIGLFILLFKLVVEKFNDADSPIGFFIIVSLAIIFATFNYFITNLIFSIPH